MPRPQIIRADTIDLQQDRNHPSAKDHSAVASGGKPGSIAPSQAHALMNVVQEQAHEQHELLMVHDNMIGDPYIPDTSDHYHDHGNGYSYGNGMDDDMHDEEETDEDMLDKMSSSPSIADEDIDFEFVYALHTFIATVEGQANATKGDTMVLLDDSNSYWWLVRVVKDSTIGYLPAEHIETPSERLARLNKHRNIDFSSRMLGDNPEKSKNPLKKAIRRRNAKTVQFAPPTYVEASDVEYSTDEEDADGEYYSNEDEGAAFDEDETIVGSESRSDGSPMHEEDDEIVRIEAPDTTNRNYMDNEHSIRSVNEPEHRTSDEIFAPDRVDGPAETKASKPSMLRHHHDSFLGEVDSEPRRITLTPKLVRDDANVSTGSNVTPVKPKTSLDKMVRREDALSPPPESKEKVKKEKKSVLGSLFKRRKNKNKEEEIDEFLHSEKKSSESLRDDSSSLPGSSRSGGVSFEQSPQLQQQRPQKQDSTPPLQQQQQQQSQSQSRQQEKMLQNPPQRQAPEPSQPFNSANTIRAVEAEAESEKPLGLTFATPVQPIDSQQSTVIRPSLENAAQPISTNPFRQRKQSETNISIGSAASSSPIFAQPSADVTPILTSVENYSGRPDGYYSDTPEQLTPHEPPSLIPDNGSGSEDNNLHDISPTDSNHPDNTRIVDSRGNDSIWSESALQAYFDEDNHDIRDFLVVVNAKSDVRDVKSHPQIAPLFADANSQLKAMTSRLDSLLDQWMHSRSPRV